MYSISDFYIHLPLLNFPTKTVFSIVVKFSLTAFFVCLFGMRSVTWMPSWPWCLFYLTAHWKSLLGRDWTSKQCRTSIGSSRLEFCMWSNHLYFTIKGLLVNSVIIHSAIFYFYCAICKNCLCFTLWLHHEIVKLFFKMFCASQVVLQAILFTYSTCVYMFG